MSAPFDEDSEETREGKPSDASQDSLEGDDQETFQLQSEQVGSEQTLESTIDGVISPLAQTIDQGGESGDERSTLKPDPDRPPSNSETASTDEENTFVLPTDEKDIHEATHLFDTSHNVAFSEAGDTRLHATVAPRADDSSVRDDDIEAPNVDLSLPNGEPDREKIPGFKILDELGRGAFGIVYRAVDVKLDREVAIKLPLLKDQSLAQKYLIEARNAAKIDAVGIVPVFQVGSTRLGQPFVVQKLIDGSTLSSIHRKSAPLPASWAISMIRKVAVAIGKAHKAGLVHRDLKPANILIDQQGDPWVADFGLSVLEEDQKKLRGEIAGTPLYMAPEQLSGRADWLDGRADIWALGIILYETLAGKPPFEAEEFSELKEQIRNRHPKPLSQRNSELPTELDEVFNRCCAKDVSDRFPSAQELANQLDAILADSDLPLEEIAISAAPDGRTTIRSRAVSNTQARRTAYGKSTLVQPHSESATSSVKWLSIGLAAVALVCIGGFGWMAYVLNQGVNPAPDPSALAPPEPETRSDSVNPTPNLTDDGNPDAMEDPEPPRPELVVSQAGDTAFQTLAEAIELAMPGETITIRPGTYRERLVIEKNLAILGQGSREEVLIVTEEGPAFEIKGDSQVTMTNVTVLAEGSQLNAIELISGNLDLNGCKLGSSSYDCLKAHQGTSFSAKGCRFESHKHPAIVADHCQSFDIRKCDFRFDVLNIGIEREDPVVGVQLTGSAGSIRESTFTGTGELGKGISAQGSQGELLVANCEFTSLQHGMEIFDCKNVKVISLCKFSDCEVGIYAESSNTTFLDTSITDCDYATVLMEESSCAVRNATLSNSKKVGLWLDNSRASLTQCEISGKRENPAGIGVMVDHSNTDALALKSDESGFIANGIGVLLVSGKVALEGGLVSANASAGIAVVSLNQLPQDLRRRTQDARNQRILLATDLRANASKDGSAILFNAPGQYELKDCLINDLSNQNRPALSGRLTTKRNDGVTEVIPR